jgi:hypothetical protein
VFLRANQRLKDGKEHTYKINDTRLHRCLDHMLLHKTRLEQLLKQRYGELFGAEFDVLLYDLTSTYVRSSGEQ